ncbi:hypothetical protein BD311DRAFT_294844 [Dichomitus squalens]|uniref:Uncharacterized protein n=1 Tax=Dichomitus squalens TaxID=114155 RepID=A0A4Q9N462_9APHY|nr:hypothetical protein BD311DRAFT_294844 [Dichomitus squalens]
MHPLMTSAVYAPISRPVPFRYTRTLYMTIPASCPCPCCHTSPLLYPSALRAEHCPTTTHTDFIAHCT